MYKRLSDFDQTQEENQKRSRKALDEFEQQIIVMKRILNVKLGTDAFESEIQKYAKSDFVLQIETQVI